MARAHRTGPHGRGCAFSLVLFKEALGPGQSRFRSPQLADASLAALSLHCFAAPLRALSVFSNPDLGKGAGLEAEILRQTVLVLLHLQPGRVARS
ncbi:hypothetical protein SKAU_G00303800 [Synaphobranchus kaupii]|uniref:Uncharacterized protein n=1 Tax=Synaphobranchus kaupii TaxID=118154 RepID=A0A9Q1EWD2_SYNKA|nr:hypothetical protein SKAU_G00303800 [Synaphobranchus kaupii]